MRKREREREAKNDKRRETMKGVGMRGGVERGEKKRVMKGGKRRRERGDGAGGREERVGRGEEEEASEGGSLLTVASAC